MAIKTLIFDFDGTIVDSNELKNKAYFELFPRVSQKAKELIGEISCGSRKTRYQIIREILSALKETGEINFSDVEEEIKRCAEQYGKIVENEMLKNNGVPGAFEELWFLHNNKYALYLLSGTPLKPLLKTVEKMVASGKIPPFKKIYGRIDDADEKLFKEQVIAEIIRAEGVSVKEIALIGDGVNERDVALEVGCVFIGVANESNHWKTDNVFPVITNLKELTLKLNL